MLFRNDTADSTRQAMSRPVFCEWDSGESHGVRDAEEGTGRGHGTAPRRLLEGLRLRRAAWGPAAPWAPRAALWVPPSSLCT